MVENVVNLNLTRDTVFKLRITRVKRSRLKLRSQTALYIGNISLSRRLPTASVHTFFQGARTFKAGNCPRNEGRDSRSKLGRQIHVCVTDDASFRIQCRCGIKYSDYITSHYITTVYRPTVPFRKLYEKSKRCRLLVQA